MQESTAGSQVLPQNPIYHCSHCDRKSSKFWFGNSQSDAIFSMYHLTILAIMPIFIPQRYCDSSSSSRNQIYVLLPTYASYSTFESSERTGTQISGSFFSHFPLFEILYTLILQHGYLFGLQIAGKEERS